MKKIIVLLGASNDKKGNLSQMAIDRLECAYSIYADNSNVTFLCTGGFGEHFNTTDVPHAEYLKKWLLLKGVNDKDFLPFIISSNTKEDIQGINDIMKYISTDLLIVVTSDFHIKRVKTLYKMLVPYENAIFISAISDLKEDELFTRMTHEEKAIELLKQ